MRFIFPVRVYYEDTDAGGVVYYANYLKFCERARTELLRAKGYVQSDLKNQYGILFVIRKVQIDYLRPAVFDDLLNVSATVSTLKKASVHFEQTICCADKLLCTATIEVACVRADTFKPCAIPNTLAEQLLHES